MIHIISKFDKSLLDNCSANIILLQDGIYLGLLSPTQQPIYAIAQDVQSRGITNYPANIELIDYPYFVELLTTQNSITW